MTRAGGGLSVVPGGAGSIHFTTMPTFNVELPDELRAVAEAGAAEAGYADVGEYLSQLIRNDALAGPPELLAHSDETLAALLATRVDGPWVEVNEADFEQIRRKFEGRVGPRPGRQP